MFTVSETSRVLIAERLGVPTERIAVVPEAPDSRLRPAEPRRRSRPQLAPLGLGSGSVVPRLRRRGQPAQAPRRPPRRVRNARRARRAGAAARRRRRARRRDVPLVGGRRRASQIGELGLRSRVILPGHVSDETLACLYAGALAFVSPSASEGFGLPAVEAAASGTALVLSDIPAHRESLGDAALYVPVGDSAASGRRAARHRRRRPAPAAARRRGARACVRADLGRGGPEARGSCCGRRSVAEPFSICMVTTFYPPHHFGGDAVYTERLVHALARRGHDVTVVYSADAYRALGGNGEAAAAPEPGRHAPSARAPAAEGRVAGRVSHRPAGVLRARAGRRAVPRGVRRRSTSTTSRSSAARRCSATGTP